MTVVVVGAGLAGLRTCEALRRRGYDGRLLLVGDETHAPYDRPPLSKQVLRGDVAAEKATLRTADDLAGIGVEVQLGCAARALQVRQREVVLEDGSVVNYHDVVVATGAQPRLLRGVDASAVHVLRTVDDSMALHDALHAGGHVVVVGAGFIGLEVAASARAVDCTVTVVEPLPAPLARALDPQVGAAVAALHVAHGVDLRCGVGVTGVEAASGNGRAGSRRVRLTDGSTLVAEVVVVGVGVTPATGWLAGSGLTLDDGVVCDASLRAAPGVWAVGDVARWAAPALGALVRVEHWTNAAEQADHVARAIVDGAGEAFDEVPYFWSDQYDAKVQCLGFRGLGDELLVVHGALDEPKFVALVRHGDALAGVVGLRSPGQVMRLRPLLAARPSWSDAVAATAPA